MITDLAESGAGDQTIMDIAGHVSKNMLKHYSHIRMEAKRDALESIVRASSDKKAAIEGLQKFEGRIVVSPRDDQTTLRFSSGDCS